MALVNALGNIALDASVQDVKDAITSVLAPSFATESTTPLGIDATFTGSAHDSQSAAARVAVSFFADQASATGGCKIQISANGTDGWVTVAAGSLTADTPLQLVAFLTARYWRAVMVNGGVAQTSLSITSGQFRA